MNFKKHMKRFFTLSRSADGFTLVELIVVIAILAILGGVAVPAYSGYITRTNKTADQKLASEIENALILAMYSNALNEGDYVVVQYDKNPQWGNLNTDDKTTVDAAMRATFGDGWQTSLKLSYAEWPSLVVANKQTMELVNNSSFATGKMDILLDKVQGITNEFTGYLEGGSFTATEELDAYLKEMGIDYTNNAQGAANGTVMFVGNAVANIEVSDAEFYQAWMYGQFGSLCNNDPMVSNSMKYACVLGMAEYVDQKEALTGTSSYVAKLEAAKGTAIIGAMDTVMNEIGAAYGSTHVETYFNGETGDVTKSRGYADALAFKAYMKGLDSTKNDLAAKTDMSSKNYFNDGTVMNHISNVLDAGDILGKFDTENGFVFYYSNGEIFSITG